MSVLHRTILDLIPESSRVLDLGCGDGELLQKLSQEKTVKGYGIEINADCVKTCIEKGLSVFQDNINEGLSGFSNRSYDFVILSQTLQQIKNPIHVMNEICRVGKQAIVTFPNFSHWKCRLELLRGKIPKSESLPYEWYDTPNIRVISIRSFKKICKTHQFEIVKELGYTRKPFLRPLLNPLSNLLSEKCLFLIKK